eukprot:CAMPEP_0170171052 /NCGR_PEP_ID=MMETSP0040_2-20121228/4114_1 /TAXON_ID=641309 /ORGANISM="Lotharella oceanica, Strain CCMP622" /LENGTH=348 /DNA_ID=CAMNT_0010410847 /DNA_START=75 /DNA_END=1121 /DNA_ORIENTATION=-
MTSKMSFDDKLELEGPVSNEESTLSSLTARCHQILLVGIFLASITLMSLEVLYLQHIRRKGLVTSIFCVEVFLDVLIVCDVVRRARRTTCSTYLQNMWNWLDLLTFWVIAIHWIIVIVNPLVQVYSDAWIVLRYSFNSARVIYWMVRNVFFFKYEYYKELPRDVVGDLEWLPVTDLNHDAGGTALFDDDEHWSPGKMFKSEFIVEQFKAPNAVNAAEAAERERKEKEAEEAKIAAEEAKRLAEEKQINDILGPPTEKLPPVDPQDEMAEAKRISFSEEAAAFDHDAEALAAGLESLEEDGDGDHEEGILSGMGPDIELRLEGGEPSGIVDDGGEGVSRAEALLFNYEE